MNTHSMLTNLKLSKVLKELKERKKDAQCH